MSLSCCGVILAGGQSSRMGQDKADLLRNDITMLDFCHQLFEQCGVDNVVVSRNLGEGISDLFSGLGPLGGIYSTVTQVTADAALILPVDMPLLCAQDLILLIEHGRQQMVPVYYENCYLPLYLPINADVKAYLEHQLCHQGNLKVLGLIEHFNGVPITPQSSQCLINTNTPQQWQKALQQLSIGDLNGKELR